MKKRILSLLIALLAVVVLVGCKKTTQPKNNGAKITVWCGESVVELTKQQIAEYNKTSEYKFEAQVQPVSEKEAGADVVASVEQAADLYCFAQDQLAMLVEASAISKLGDAASKFVTDNNDAGSAAATKVGDSYYAYPLSSDNGYFMFYDKRYIQESSLDSLDALLADCVAADKNFSFEVGDNAWYIAAFFFGQDLHSEWSTDDNGKFLQADDTFSDATKGLIALKGLKALVEHSKFVSSSGNDFSKENVATASAVCITGTWNSESISTTLGENMGVTDLPNYKVGDQEYHLGSFAGYKMIGVKPQKDAKKQAELHKLAQYLSSEECQRQRFTAVQWGPSNKSAQNDDAVKANLPLAALAKQSQYAIPQGQYPSLWWDIAGAITESAKAAKNDTELAQVLVDYKAAIQSLANTDGELHWDERFKVDFEKYDWAVTGKFAGHNYGTEDGEEAIAMSKTEDKLEWTSGAITLAEGDEVIIVGTKKADATLEAGAPETVYVGRNKLKITVDNAYFIGEGSGKAAKAGDYKIVLSVNDKKAPSITFDAQKKVWGIVGAFNGWGSQADIVMTESETTPGTYTAQAVFENATEWKIRANSDWAVNYGATGSGNFDGNAASTTEGVAGGQNIAVAAGTYTITLVFGADDTVTISWTKTA